VVLSEAPSPWDRRTGLGLPAQSKRFIEAAKRLGVDESGEAFHKALRDVPYGRISAWYVKSNMELFSHKGS
jgi:hypothetical protein